MKKIILIISIFAFFSSLTPIFAAQTDEEEALQKEREQTLEQMETMRHERAQEEKELQENKENILQGTLKQILPSQKDLIEQARTSTNVSLPSGSFKYELVPAIIKIILGIAGILAFIAFVIAGIMLVISGGNEELMKKAKNIFLYSAIGLVVIATAYALVYGLSIMLTAK